MTLNDLERRRPNGCFVSFHPKQFVSATRAISAVAKRPAQ